MPNEKIEKKDPQEKVEETEKVETEKVEAEKKEETKPTEQEEKATEKKEEVVETKTEEEKADEQDPAPVVEEEKESNKGVRVEDLMLKEDFEARFSALEAKLDAIIKESSDLKEQNAQLLDGKTKAENETENLKNKYERADFGNISSRNMGGGNEPKQYQSFDEYSKEFM